MPEAFIMMQIGDDQLERVCAEAIVPAVSACGFEPRRVDKHNQGGLLKSEIIQFIQRSDILIADLTNERPNVYLEIGYAMGVDKFRNLLLLVREDHFPDSPNHRAGGPKVHFDLAGYDILRWHSDRIAELRVELEKRIRRRLAIVASSGQTSISIWDAEWIDGHRKVALGHLAAAGLRGFMELRSALHPPKISRTQTELNEAAREAPIHTFGWPIGIYMTRDDVRPRPTADGIKAVIPGMLKRSVDYWTIRRNGDLYNLSSLFEDDRDEGKIYFNSRIVRVTEGLLYCLRLYDHLGADRALGVSLAIRHGGLRGRVLTGSGHRPLMVDGPTEEDEIESEVTGTIGEIEANLVSAVKDLVAPVFRVFDFFELGDAVYEEIVERFVQGEVT